MEPFIIKITYKNLTGFLTTKELNYRQVKQAEILVEYYFKIKHIKGTNNIKADTLSRKVKLQGNKKLLDVILRIDKDSKIKYNYLKLIAVYKVPKSH